MAFIGCLTRTKTLWTLFALTVLLTLGFGIVKYFGQFIIIDEMYAEDDIRAHIAAMTPYQRTLHAWLTGTIDVACPFAHGGFYAGMALRFFGRYRLWLAAPSCLAIPFDLMEGFAQIMLLTGHDNYMALKLIATPVKLGLFALGLCITIAAALRALKSVRKSR